MSGILDITADAYHRDQVADIPTLSASTAHTLLTKSPLHAWTANPRNPNYIPPEEKTYFDVGTVLHSLVLEGVENVYVIHEDNYRKKEAQEARDYARAMGKVPLLAHQRDAVYEMVEAINRKLDERGISPRPFTDGAPERTIVWDEEDGVKCRARLDWLRDDFTYNDDLKSSTNAESGHWIRNSMCAHGYDIRCAFHLRGVEKALGAKPQWRWIVIEKAPPYELSVISPSADVLAMGQAKVERAVSIWRQCLKTETWAGYPREVCYAELPPWEETRWLEREAREAA